MLYTLCFNEQLCSSISISVHSTSGTNNRREDKGLHQQYQEVPIFESKEKVNLSFLSISVRNERGRILSEVCEKQLNNQAE